MNFMGTPPDLASDWPLHVLHSGVPRGRLPNVAGRTYQLWRQVRYWTNVQYALRRNWRAPPPFRSSEHRLEAVGRGSLLVREEVPVAVDRDLRSPPARISPCSTVLRYERAVEGLRLPRPATHCSAYSLNVMGRISR